MFNLEHTDDLGPCILMSLCREWAEFFHWHASQTQQDSARRKLNVQKRCNRRVGIRNTECGASIACAKVHDDWCQRHRANDKKGSTFEHRHQFVLHSDYTSGIVRCLFKAMWFHLDSPVDSWLKFCSKFQQSKGLVQLSLSLSAFVFVFIISPGHTWAASLWIKIPAKSCPVDRTWMAVLAG